MIRSPTDDEATVGTEPGAPPPTRRGRFGLDVMTLASGATLAESVSLVLSPVLTRFFDPSAFGVLAVFTSVVSIGTLFACAGYHYALVLPDEDRDAAALLRGLLRVMGVTAVLGGIGILFLGEPLCRWLRVPELRNYLWLLLPGLLTGALCTALRYWNTRQSRFGTISTLTVAGSLSRGVARVLACIPRWVGAGTLIGTKVLGEAITALGLAWTIWRRDRELFRESRPDVGRLLYRYRKFPFVNIWSSLFGTLSYQVPVMLLAVFFSASVVGHYSFGLHLIGLPAIIVGGSVAQVFFQRATEARREGRLAAVTGEMCRQLTQLGLFPFLVLGLVGREVFEVVFGPAWSEAGVYIQLLALLHCCLFVSQPISVLFSLLERQEIEALLNLFFLLSRVAAIAVGGWLGSPRLALGLQCLVGVGIWLISFNWLLRTCSVSRRVLLGVLFRNLLGSSPYLILLALGKWWWHWPALWLLLAAGVGTIAYYAGVIGRDPELAALVRLPWKRWRSRGAA